MTLILPGEASTFPSGANEPIPFDVTLAVADTSQTLFTVPVGKRLRSFSVANVSGGQDDAHVSFAAGVAATTGDTLLGRRESLSETGLDLPEGTYAFIGGAGDLPRVRGVAWVGPA